MTGKVLFIDCRKMGGKQLSRTQIAFTEEELEKIARTYHNWRGSPWSEGDYENEEGFCKAATLGEIGEHGYALTPGRYVGASLDEDPEAEPFEEAFPRLLAELKTQFDESHNSERAILKRLSRLEQ